MTLDLKAEHVARVIAFGFLNNDCVAPGLNLFLQSGLEHGCLVSINMLGVWFSECAPTLELGVIGGTLANSLDCQCTGAAGCRCYRGP